MVNLLNSIDYRKKKSSAWSQKTASVMQTRAHYKVKMCFCTSLALQVNKASLMWVCLGNNVCYYINCVCVCLPVLSHVSFRTCSRLLLGAVTSKSNIHGCRGWTLQGVGLYFISAPSPQPQTHTLTDTLYPTNSPWARPVVRLVHQWFIIRHNIHSHHN